MVNMTLLTSEKQAISTRRVLSLSAKKFHTKCSKIVTNIYKLGKEQ